MKWVYILKCEMIIIMLVKLKDYIEDLMNILLVVVE